MDVLLLTHWSVSRHGCVVSDLFQQANYPETLKTCYVVNGRFTLSHQSTTLLRYSVCTIPGLQSFCGEII